MPVRARHTRRARRYRLRGSHGRRETVSQVQRSSWYDRSFETDGHELGFVFCGDIAQSDLTREHEKSGISDFIRIINEMKEFTCVEFDIGDIVRSGLVKSYLIAKYNLGFS